LPQSEAKIIRENQRMAHLAVQYIPHPVKSKRSFEVIDEFLKTTKCKIKYINITNQSENMHKVPDLLALSRATYTKLQNT